MPLVVGVDVAFVVVAVVADPWRAVVATEATDVAVAGGRQNWPN